MDQTYILDAIRYTGWNEFLDSEMDSTSVTQILELGMGVLQETLAMPGVDDVLLFNTGLDCQSPHVDGDAEEEIWVPMVWFHILFRIIKLLHN